MEKARLLDLNYKCTFPQFGFTAFIGALLVIFSSVSPADAQIWGRTSVPLGWWLSTTSSADGARVAACFYDYTANGYAGAGAIYTSTNSGATWAPVLSSTSRFNSIAASQDATRLVAGWSAGMSGGLFLSTNFGVSWSTITNLPNQPFSQVACSADGQKLIAAAYGIYASTNGGVSWVLTSAPATTWRSIASSADGGELAGVPVSGTGVYVSQDSGSSWQMTTVTTGVSYQGVACSGDGRRMVAVASWPYSIFVSDYSGFLWAQTSVPAATWYATASSTNGANLVAVSFDGLVAVSHDFGATWTSDYLSQDGFQWDTVASSADGSKLVVGGLPALPHIKVTSTLHRRRRRWASASQGRT